MCIVIFASVYLAGAFRWNITCIETSRRKKKWRSDRATNDGGGGGREGDLDLIKFLLLTRVIRKRINSAETAGRDVIPAPSRCISGPTIPFSISRSHTHPRSCSHPSLGDDVNLGRHSIAYTVGGVFRDFWDILYGKERGRRGFRGLKSIIRLHSKPPPPPLPPPSSPPDVLMALRDVSDRSRLV